MWLRIGRSKNKEEKSSQPRSVKKKKKEFVTEELRSGILITV